MDKVEKLATDFEEKNGPFSRDVFPEARLVEALGERDKLAYLSMFVQWDYNRGVDNLVEDVINIVEAEGPEVLRPRDVVAQGREYMRSITEEHSTRYPTRDADGYYDNCEILVDEYDGKWENLIEASDYDAPTLVNLLEESGFLYLKGVKLAPFYARVVHDEYHELDNVWTLDIPVDVHIRRLSRDLFGDVDDDEIREQWRTLGEELGISPAMVDGALWQIGYSWDDWGEDYWEEL